MARCGSRTTRVRGEGLGALDFKLVDMGRTS
jgi:hypothetical protein